VIQLGQNSPEVFVCMSSIIVKMLTVSLYFGPQNLPIVGFTGLAVSSLCLLCWCTCCNWKHDRLCDNWHYSACSVLYVC